MTWATWPLICKMEQCVSLEAVGVRAPCTSSGPGRADTQSGSSLFFYIPIPTNPKDFAQPDGEKPFCADSFQMHWLACWVSVHLATFPYLTSGHNLDIHPDVRCLQHLLLAGLQPLVRKRHVIMRHCGCCFCGLKDLELNLF